jgi:hypothetical protein
MCKANIEFIEENCIENVLSDGKCRREKHTVHNSRKLGREYEADIFSCVFIFCYENAEQRFTCK